MLVWDLLFATRGPQRRHTPHNFSKLLPMRAHNYCRLNVCGMQCTSDIYNILKLVVGMEDQRVLYFPTELVPACHTP